MPGQILPSGAFSVGAFYASLLHVPLFRSLSVQLCSPLSVVVDATM